MRKVLITGFAAMALLAAAQIQAQPEGPRHGHGGPEFGADRPFGPIGPRLADRLELDDAQRDQIHAIMDQASPQREDLADAFEANREALREASAFDTYDEARVAELAVEQGSLHARRTELATRVRYQTLAVLTPEQRESLASLRQQRKERRQQGDKMRHRRGLDNG